MAQVFSGEIISADSMQLYQQMDIGTAKPTLAEQSAVRHHLIDVIHPKAPCDAAAYAAMAQSKIEELVKRFVLPFVVGGTGLYIKALLHGLSRARPADPEVLTYLKQEAEEKGALFVHQRLHAVDPVSAAKIHPKDVFRIIRALEIYLKTGSPMSAYQSAHGFAQSRYQPLKIGLYMDRNSLYERIDKRVDEMLAAGLLAEVKQLLEQGCTPDLKSMQSIGYRHLTAYLLGRTNWEEALVQLKRDSRRYAKRQLTWFRADPDIKWYQPGQTEELRKEIELFLKSWASE